MINEFSTHAKPKNSKALAFAIGALGGAVVFFTAALFTENFKWIPQICSLIMLTLALMLLTRYVLPKMYYDVAVDDDGSPLFVVRQQIGKRQITLCRIFFADILKIEGETAAERRAHKTPEGYVRYTYVPTFLPENTYRIIAVSRYERAEIVIECSEQMAQTLSDYADKAKAGRANDNADGEY